MLYKKCDKYLYSTSDLIESDRLEEYVTQGNKKKVISFPCIVDSEFQTYSKKWAETLDKAELGSITITQQIKGLDGAPSKIYCDPDILHTDAPRHFDMWQGEAVFLQYLSDCGLKIKTKRCTSTNDKLYLSRLNKVKVFRVIVYAHFAVADFYRIFRGEMREDVLRLSRRKRGSKGGTIDQKRRLITQSIFNTKGSPTIKDWIKTDYIIEINGLEFALQVSCIDSGAIHGPVSLKDLAANSGTNLQYKDNLSKADKEDMLTTYVSDKNRFFDYAMGDLAVYDCLFNNARLMRKVYQRLELEHYYSIPNLTIGSTVSRLLTSAIAKRFENPEPLESKEVNEIVDRYCSGASAKELVKANNWSGLNAKVLGGRCFNNRPTHTIDSGVIVDIDISGAYATAMREIEYPLGNPVVFGEAYNLNSKNNKYLSLREFYNQYENNLVDGLYQIWFTVKGELPVNQDFFNSYFPPKNWKDIVEDDDDEDDETNWLDRQDNSKIFSHEITNGLLTSDGAEWLNKVCSRKLKNYILDHSEVKTALFYDAQYRVDSVEELVKMSSEHNDSNTSEYEDGVTTNTNRDSKYWCSINLGELVIDDLLSSRKYYKQVTSAYKVLKIADGDRKKLSEDEKSIVDKGITIGEYENFEEFKNDALAYKKHPLDTLYKLCCNTTYGDVVSKYFDVSNVVCGNNITAKIRALVWYLEKGLYSHGSITDGGVFNANNVCFPKTGNRKLNDNTTQIYRESSKHLKQNKHIVFKPLGGFSNIFWEGEKIIFYKNCKEPIIIEKGLIAAKAYIDKLALDHLKSLFDVSVINLFTFESKGIVQSAVFRGQSDYGLYGGNHEAYKSGECSSYAMRAYPARTGLPKKYMDSLHTNPTLINRSDPFYKSQIVKVGLYRQHFNSRFKDSIFKPGDSIQIVGLFREFSLSQFTFKNSRQRLNWEKETERLKKKNGQSYEMYYSHGETLQYQRMIEEIDHAISKGYETFRHYRDENYNFKGVEHPKYAHYLEEKDRLFNLGTKQEISTIASEFDFIDSNDEDFTFIPEQYIEEFKEGILLSDEEAEQLIDW